ncbi:hypothetical protein A2714_01630 [Candidatus Woesebacteria bacterium RIFCSPHIGHO2_01_FULL_38_9]|uniref:Glutamine--fructose-6-phosphate aminotransferase [isomerizing] n=2 Tax=Candidatus Woeseibacteriota TaxID=1752722 RepID=A0A1F7Y155_9BACT|nr:MAG: hypothetical protein A2714_01630 [Candidatus Woesebacteria bacterium RIFCSPHIGHO2_01_FULL_38_9]OGM61015.1 MAG: hypothetical protein A3A75_02035 [Candidatus Woesebacteria bacterium RIFCSPLOWO2_01_FULL_39_10]
MCGIFGYIGKKINAGEIVFEGLKFLEYRGYDSWGVAVMPSEVNPKKNSEIFIEKKAGKIGTSTISDMPRANISFGHTRWATHGKVTTINAHPHLDCTKRIALVHNGIIENYEEIKRKLIKKGHKFISETDSEVAVHLIEDYMKSMDIESATRHAFLEFEGLNAFIVMNSGDEKILAVRNGSPLVIGYGKNENFLASDASAILTHTRTVHFINDFEMAILSKEKIIVKNVHTARLVLAKRVNLDWKTDFSDLGQYPNFMFKEINEQSQLIFNIAKSSAKLIQEIADIIKTRKNCYLLGCGSASYVAIAGSYLFAKLAKKQMNPAVGSEFGYQLDFLNKDSLVIALSQSGETMDILESVKKAKENRASIVAITNTVGSTLYREADYKLPLNAGIEISVASTKALTAKLSYLILIAHALAGNMKEGNNMLLKAGRSTEKLLGKDSLKKIKKLAKKLKNSKNIFVIGRGLSYPASLETAIKIKEIAYIHAEGMAAGELKHGPLALVEKGTPCISFLPNDETYGANLAGAMEMKARRGFIIGISAKPHEVFDYYLHVEDAGVATIIPNIITGQLLAYYLATIKNLDPDKPRNLAKSVTVK